MNTPKLSIDVWSDIACPWCYVGKRRLEAALARFPHRDAVKITWRAFELDPAAPAKVDSSQSHAERIASKYGTPVARAEEMIARMTETAKKDGLDFHFERAQSGNTFDAHRVLHLAEERGVQDAVKERFMHAYFTEGALMSDAETLIGLASDAGLVADEVREVLASDRYAKEVRADEDEARKLGINGVPFFALAGRFGLSGAQPPEAILEALFRAWQEIDASGAPLDEGATCGPDGCT